MMAVSKIARRTFLVGAAAVAGGIGFGYYLVTKPYPNPLTGALIDGEETFNPFIKISKDNVITVIAPRAEMGQGVQTTLAAMVAEELDVALDEIIVEHGPVSPAYYNTTVLRDVAPFAFFNENLLARMTRATIGAAGKLLAIQVTGGSASIRDYYEKLRMAGAGARHLLVTAASNRWQVDAASLVTASGRVLNPQSGDVLTYGQLSADAVGLDIPGDINLKDKEYWNVLGQSQQRVDVEAKVTGEAVFGIDVQLPDMLYGTVRMSPRFGATPRTSQTAPALVVPGVLKVIPLATATGSGFGVIATSTWAAFNGAQALQIDWREAQYPKFDDAIYDDIRKTMKKDAGYSLRNDGDCDVSFADASQNDIVDAEYTVPYLAHGAMEPMNATARFADGVLEIWAPTQAPTLLQMTASSLVDVAASDVKVNPTYLGGGFGRRLEVDFALYAVEMAKHTEGLPIKVTWSREEDMTHDTYRPAAIAKMRARINKHRPPESLDIQIGAPSIVKSFVGRVFPQLPIMGPDRTIVDGCFDQPYDIANYRVSATKVDNSIPVGFWRSVGHSYNGFFHECFLDEMAIASDLDPLEMRLKLLSRDAVASATLVKVAEMAGWDKKRENDVGMGIAHVHSFDSWVAEVVKIRMEGDNVRVENVWVAADLGTVLDPQNTKAQISSGVIFGLSSAIGQETTFEKGEVVENNFDQFPLMGIDQCPAISIELLETSGKIGGAGEIGTPPSIPALANAIYDATGLRLRRLPLSNGIDFM